MMAIIKLDNVSKKYKKGETVIKNCNLEIE